MGAGIPDLGNISDYLSQSGGADVAGVVPGVGQVFEGGKALYDIIASLMSGNYGSGIGELLLGPLGGMFGNLLQGLFSGVPKGAKTEGAASTLEASGNPLSADLGKAITSFGGGNGSNVLSNPAFAHDTNTFADALTWLTGKALPGWKAMGSTGEIANIQPPKGAPYSKGVNIMGVQSPDQLAAQLGASPNLTPAQINSIMAQLEQVSKTPGMSVAGLKSALAPLVKSASAVPPGDINAYMNQGSGIQFPGLSSEGGGQGGGSRFNPLTLLPLLNLFNFGNNSDQGNNQSQQNSMLQSLFRGGAAVGYPTVAFPRE